MKRMLRIGLALFMVLSLFPCLFPASPAKAAAPAWSAMSSGLTWEGIYGVWGTASNDVFAVCSVGKILHYNGTEWSGVVSGSSDLFGVWGTSSTDVFAVGDGGAIRHYNGSWSTMSSGVSDRLNGVWGTASNNVFAVGDSGTILHYNGTDWSEMSSGTFNSLNSVWGTASNDVFAVGSSGTIRHYNGSSWSAMTSGTSNHLMSVWGTSSSDVYAAGYGGIIIHYNGSSWSAMTSGTSAWLNSVWGTASGDVFAVGVSGTIRHYNGTAWNTMDSGNTNTLWSVWGTSSSDVFAGGSSGTILHYDPTPWSTMTGGTTQQVHCLWGTAYNDVFAGHNDGIIHYNGSGWASMGLSPNAFRGIWGTSSTDVFAAATNGKIFHYNGSWSQIATTGEALASVWGTSSSNIFAVSIDGIILHYDGSSWTDNVSGTTNGLWGVWGSSSSDVFAVGNSGTIRHSNGISWSSQTSGTSVGLVGVWGSSSSDVFAVGASGTILHYDGSWSTMTSGTSEDLDEVWGTSSSDVYAVGSSGTILHYDGTSWSPMTSGTTSSLSAVWGSSSSNVFVGGNLGNTILHAYAEISVSTASIDFGNVAVGSSSPPETVTVSNDGNLNLVIASVQVDGGDSDQFSMQNDYCSGATLMPGESATVQAVFNPTLTGAKSSTLEVPSDDPDEAMVLVTLSGTGVMPEMSVEGNSVLIADGDASPSPADHTDFGSANASGQTVVRTFNIKNTGDYELSLTGGATLVAITGAHAADFTVTQDPSTPVAPSGNTTFQVTFDPSNTGLRTATVSIDNNDSDENPYNFDIQGTGVSAPPAAASPLCEGVTDPTGVTDATPEFSWTFSDPDAGDTQGDYQILVASTSANLTAGTGDVWDSTQVSSNSSEVSYGGPALSDNQTYYWKAKTWDNYGTEGDYCTEQQFTTGSPQSEVWVDDDWAGSYHGKTVDSHTFNTDAFATFKDAIEIVSSNSTVPGTVNVAAGTYNEQVFISKAYLTVQSTAGADATTINGTGVANSSPQPASLVWLQKDYTTFKGFTVRNYPSAWVGSNCVNGAVIWVQGWDGHGLTDGISNCQVSENKVNDSPSGIPGIYVGGAAVSANVTQNEITSSGAEGILVTTGGMGGSSAARITSNTITDASSYGICLRPESGTTRYLFSDAVISGNEISGGEHGIGILHADGSTGYIRIEDNNITGVVTGEGEGIEINDCADVHVLGNTLQGNGTGIQVTGSVPGGYTDACYAHNNNISGSTAYGVDAGSCAENFTATLNWWGDASGPYHATTNPTGTGDNVTDKVDYSPWLGAGVADCKLQTTSSDNVTVDAKSEADTEVLKKGTGTPTINVVQSTGNPGGSAPGGFTAVGKYIDVHADNTTGVEEIEIRNYYTLAEIAGLNEATLKLSWWDGTAWEECSNSGATYPAGEPTYRGYVWAVITDNTTPDLAYLTGTPFMAMGRPSPARPTGGGGEVYFLKTNVLGTKLKFITSYSGKVKETVDVTSPDGMLTINILEGTITKDKNGNGLSTLNISINENPPPPPEDNKIIGLTYDFEPAGATFDPPITAILKYEHADIPEGVAEEDLVLAYYDQDAGEWVECECTCDPEANCVTACVCHFTCFALLGQQAPPAPAAFLVSNLSIQPTEVEPGEAVTVTVSIANTGGVEGTYGLVLKINGVKEAEKNVAVTAGSSQSVSFGVSREAPGNYTVNVNGLENRFTVIAPTLKPAPVLPPTEPAPVPAKPINWAVLGGIIATVIVAGLLVCFLVRRRYA